MNLLLYADLQLTQRLHKEIIKDRQRLFKGICFLLKEVVLGVGTNAAIGNSQSVFKVLWKICPLLRASIRSEGKQV